MTVTTFCINYKIKRKVSDKNISLNFLNSKFSQLVSPQTNDCTVLKLDIVLAPSSGSL